MRLGKNAQVEASVGSPHRRGGGSRGSTRSDRIHVRPHPSAAASMVPHGETDKSRSDEEQVDLNMVTAFLKLRSARVRSMPVSTQQPARGGQDRSTVAARPAIDTGAGRRGMEAYAREQRAAGRRGYGGALAEAQVPGQSRQSWNAMPGRALDQWNTPANRAAICHESPTIRQGPKGRGGGGPRSWFWRRRRTTNVTAAACGAEFMGRAFLNRSKRRTISRGWTYCQPSSGSPCPGSA